MNELLASAIDAFTAAWVRPGQLMAQVYVEGEDDEEP